MPPVQNLYTEGSAKCEKCGEYVHGIGSELPAENRRKRYLCQTCTDLKNALDALFQKNPLWVESARDNMDHLEKMLGSIFVNAWDNPPVLIDQVCQEHRELLEHLRYLVNEAESEQPWD